MKPRLMRLASKAKNSESNPGQTLEVSRLSGPAIWRRRHRRNRIWYSNTARTGATDKRRYLRKWPWPQRNFDNSKAIRDQISESDCHREARLASAANHEAGVGSKSCQMRCWLSQTKHQA